MKKRIYLAFILYITGLLHIVYWYVFCYRNEALFQQDFMNFKLKYVESLPEFLRPLFSGNPLPVDVISFLMLLAAGIIFIREKKIFYKILGISAFLFSFQYLFSMM